MFDRRLEAGVVSYNASLSASEKGSQWAQALALLCETLDRRLESNVVNYNASISASEKGSQWAQAMALLREMFDRRLESDVVSCSASISASEKGLQWVQALQLLREMIVTCVGLGIAMDSLLRVASLLHRCDVWDDVVDRNIYLSAHNQVLRALCQNLM